MERDMRICAITPPDGPLPRTSWLLGRVCNPEGIPVPFNSLTKGSPWKGDLPLYSAIEQRGAVTDLSLTTRMELVASKAAADALRSALSPWCQFLPLQVQGRGTGDFFVINAVTLLDALDEEKSGVSFERFPADPRMAAKEAESHRRYDVIRKHVFKQELVTAPIFRLEKAPLELFVRDDVVQMFAKLGEGGGISVRRLEAS
jgi:hypothetical protein